jgi:hypothetical protein
MNYKHILAVAVSLFASAQITHAATSRCELSNGQLANIIILTVGDKSCDGHCETKDIIVCSSLSSDDFKNALLRGTTKVGFSLTEKVAKDYEDSTITAKQLKQLTQAGIELSKEIIENTDQETGNSYLNIETFTDLTIKIAKLGAPEASFEIIEPKSVYIGGYGLFSGD